LKTSLAKKVVDLMPDTLVYAPGNPGHLSSFTGWKIRREIQQHFGSAKTEPPITSAITTGYPILGVNLPA
jgi:hypothetical protein